MENENNQPRGDMETEELKKELENLSKKEGFKTLSEFMRHQLTKLVEKEI